MAIESIEISIVAHGNPDVLINEENFLVPLGLHSDKSDDVVISYNAPGTFYRGAFVTLIREDIVEYQNVDKPNSVLIERVENSLVGVSKWMAERAAFLKGFSETVKLELLIEITMESNQMDLYLPMSFMDACVNCGLKVKILSNV